MTVFSVHILRAVLPAPVTLECSPRIDEVGAHQQHDVLHKTPPLPLGGMTRPSFKVTRQSQPARTRPQADPAFSLQPERQAPPPLNASPRKHLAPSLSPASQTQQCRRHPLPRRNAVAEPSPFPRLPYHPIHTPKHADSLLDTDTTPNTQLLRDECLFIGRVDLDT